MKIKSLVFQFDVSLQIENQAPDDHIDDSEEINAIHINFEDRNEAEAINSGIKCLNVPWFYLPKS